MEGMKVERNTEWRARRLASAMLTLDGRLPRTEVIRRALEGAISVTAAERSTLFLLSGDGRSLVATETAGPAVKPFACPVDRGIAGACFRTGLPRLVPDATLDPCFNPDIDAMTRCCTRSVIAVPLTDPDGKRLGVLEVLCPDVGAFNEMDARILSCLAPSIVLALSASEEVHRAQASADVEPSVLRAIVGESREVREAIAQARDFGSGRGNVLIRGESGTGKELFARLVHASSARAGGPLVCVNCATFTATMLESELFGCKKGAYTGADRDRVGLLAQADGGTLFLDEVGEMPEEIQAKLLRAMEEGEFYRLGDPVPIRVDVRFIGATNRDGGGRDGGPRMREDFLYRLDGFTLVIPPLRRREGDAFLIFLAMLEKRLGRTVRVAQEVKELFATHPWPGNVRDVRKAVDHAEVYARGAQEVRAEHVRRALRQPAEAPETLPPSLSKGTMKERHLRLERMVVEEEMSRHGHNRADVARVLGVTRWEIARLCKKHGLFLGQRKSRP